MSSFVTLDCPSCSRHLRFTRTLAEHELRCPSCNARLPIAQIRANTSSDLKASFTRQIEAADLRSGNLPAAQPGLDSNSPQALEQWAENYGDGWRLKRFLYLTLAGVFIAVAFYVKSYGRLGIDVWWHFGLLIIALFGFGAWIGLTQIYLLIRGLPKAGLTPQKTFAEFYYRCLQGGSPGLEAFVCLDDRAKRAAGSLQEFRSHWTKVRERLEREAKANFKDKDPDMATCFYKSAELVGPETGEYQVSFSVSVFKSSSYPNQGYKKVGSVGLNWKTKVVQIGERWYLTDPHCPEGLEGDSAEAQKAT